MKNRLVMKATVQRIFIATCPDTECEGWSGDWYDTAAEAKAEVDDHNARYHNDAERQVFG